MTLIKSLKMSQIFSFFIEDESFNDLERNETGCGEDASSETVNFHNPRNSNNFSNNSHQTSPVQNQFNLPQHPITFNHLDDIAIIYITA